MTITRSDINAAGWVVFASVLFLASGVVSVLAYWAGSSGDKIISAFLYLANAGLGWGCVECARKVFR